MGSKNSITSFMEQYSPLDRITPSLLKLFTPGQNPSLPVELTHPWTEFLPPCWTYSPLDRIPPSLLNLFTPWQNPSLPVEAVPGFVRQVHPLHRFLGRLPRGLLREGKRSIERSSREGGLVTLINAWIFQFFQSKKNPIEILFVAWMGQRGRGEIQLLKFNIQFFIFVFPKILKRAVAGGLFDTDSQEASAAIRDHVNSRKIYGNFRNMFNPPPLPHTHTHSHWHTSSYGKQAKVAEKYVT